MFLLLLVTAAIGYAFGVLAAPDGHFLSNPRGSHAFEWDVASIAATAVGTVLLAAFTGALAWTTSGDVSATWELADLTRQDQISRDRPVVVIVGITRPATRSSADGSGVQCFQRAVVQNVGLGPAVRLNVRMRYIGSEEVAPREGTAFTAALMPGENDVYEFNFDVANVRDLADQFPLTDWVLEGDYQDRRLSESYPLIDPRA
jgi:hypothetical protein